MDTRLVSLAVVLAAGSLCLAAAQDGRTVQDGVFSITQVERGGPAYETSCAACHGADLQGRDAGALVGEDFLRSWIGLPLEGLLEMLQSMPPEAASSLGDQAYLDILAYILHANGFPTGTQDLRSEVLAAVLLEGAEGPQEVPDHSLVRVVGCLTRGPRDAWIVTDSSEPDRTRDPETSTSTARRAASSIRGGSAPFELLYVFPSPHGLEGHRVEVKGFLIRGDQDAINVTAMASLSPGCD